MRPRRIFLALALVGAHALSACATPWNTVNLGGFSMAVPATMALKAGGMDSQAGSLDDATHHLSYDFGLYSDPLTTVDGATAVTQRNGVLAGLPARFVEFRRSGPSGPALFCNGVHVPQVRRSNMGFLRLTLLLCADKPDSGALAEQIFSSVKFQPAAPQ